MDKRVWSIARGLEIWGTDPRSTPPQPKSAPPKIEIQIKVIKECVCSTWNFSPLPEILETEWSLTWRRTRYFWLNAIPVKQRNVLHSLRRGRSWQQPLYIFAKTPQNIIWRIPLRRTKRLFPRKSMLSRNKYRLSALGPSRKHPRVTIGSFDLRKIWKEAHVCLPQ